MHLGDAIALPFRYLAWHYSRGFVEALALWGRSFRFVTELTAVRLHLRTFFSPFQRIEDHERGGIEDRLASSAANAMMRVVGIVARTCAIAFALGCYIVAAVGGLITIAAWLLLPAALAATLSLGFIALTR
ncbi:MAG TPA: hypothetical protein VJJ47_02125 [Candidatus Paceibacterota bacterium]